MEHFSWEGCPLRWHACALPDGPAEIACLPGVPAPGEAHTALFTAARRVEAERVFVSGPGSAATALWAARGGADVVVWTEHAAEAAALQATCDRATVAARLHLHLQADFAGLSPASCDLALLHLPRGAALQAEALDLAAALLRPGGRLAFVGARQEGVKSALKLAQARFGHAGIVARKGGFHAGLAQRPVGEFALPELAFETTPVTVDAAPTSLVSCAGAFAAGRLDVGAAALIAGMAVEPGVRVLDLGCGTGLVGLAALRRGAEVLFSDVSARAVASTRRTLAANGYPHAEVHLACGAAACPAGAFDVVLANPPFHQGHGIDFEVAQRFVAESARALRGGGRLYLVANAFLPYAPWMEAHFFRVTTAWEDGRFRVWTGRT